MVKNNGPLLNPEFNADGTLKIIANNEEQVVPISFSASPSLNMNFGSVVMVDPQGKDKKIYYGSTEYWNRFPDLVSEKGCLYLYSDWMIDPDTERKIVGIKVGDGETLLKDLSATDQIWQDHMNDMIHHITPEERAYWNDKVADAYNEELERLKFYK